MVKITIVEKSCHVYLLTLPTRDKYNDYLPFVVSGYWHFTTVMCNVFITADVLMCTSSILHLCSISVQRYIAISRPLKWRNKSKSIVAVKIGLIWVAAIVISSPVTILGARDPANILNNRQCVLKNSSFIIYGSILAFFIPLVIMVISYALTARLLYKKSKLSDPCRVGEFKEGTTVIRRSKSVRRKDQGSPSSIREKQQELKYSNNEGINNDPNTGDNYSNVEQSTADENSRMLNSLTVCKPGSRESVICNGELKPCFLEVPRLHGLDSSSDSLHNSMINSDNIDTDLDFSEDDHSKSLNLPFTDSNSQESPGKTSIRSTILYKATSFLSLSRQDKQSDKSTVRTEQKASKVLGLVFALFLLCWLPFFILNILPVICNTCRAHPVAVSTFSWLGWASSTINPIIYTMFNKTFKRTFIKFLCCRYRLEKRTSQSSPVAIEAKRFNDPVLIRHSA